MFVSIKGFAYKYLLFFKLSLSNRKWKLNSSKLIDNILKCLFIDENICYFPKEDKDILIVILHN